MGFSRASKFFIIFFITIIAIGCCIAGFGFGAIYAGNRHVTEADMLKEFQPSLPSTLLDIHGDVITEFFAEQKRDIIPGTRISSSTRVSASREQSGLP